MAFPPLLFAADLERAQSWTAVIRRSRNIRLLASIDLPASGVDGLEEAVEARPDCSVAVWAAGPREAASIAERLTEHSGPCLLHPPPARVPLGSGVQLAHGWLTLSGLGALDRLFASRAVETVRLSVRGLPEGRAPGLIPALYHACTLVQRLGREVSIVKAVLEREDDLALTLIVDEIPWRVDVGARGQELRLVVRTAEGDYTWTADGVSESLQRPRAEPRAIPVTPWAERCLRQLETPTKGADLADGRAARTLIDQVEVALERRLPPDRFVVTSTEEGLAPLGLAGDLPAAVPLVPAPPISMDLPLEALAYTLELKPAVFLTVAPQDEARVRATLEGHIERRERRVQIGPSDAWVDDPTVGEPRVELYAARDRHAVERLMSFQTSDPTDALTQIGALLGYPACCVQAFAALGDRSNNSYNRVAAAVRTSVGPGPWPAILDDTSVKLLPHFVCTYRCERSFQQARRLLDALGDERPAVREELVSHLGGPVLYFDHTHQLRFRGEVRDGISVRYHSVSMPLPSSEPFARLGGAIAQGDRLVLTDGKLTVYAGEQRLFGLERTDPHLGVLMPFGSTA